jgi:hypothetical protein
LTRPQHWGAGADRLFGRFLASCAGLTAVLIAAELAIAPEGQRGGLLLVGAVIGVVVVLAAWFLKRSFSRRVFVVAGGHELSLSFGFHDGRPSLRFENEPVARRPLPGHELLIAVGRRREPSP